MKNIIASIIIATTVAFTVPAYAAQCTTDIQCEAKAAKRIVSLEKKIALAEVSIPKAQAKLDARKVKLVAMKDEVAKLKDTSKQ